METLRQLLKERSTEFYIFLILLWVLPGVGLLILGLVFLYHHGWFWWFSAGMIVLALITLALRLFLSKKEQAQAENLELISKQHEISEQKVLPDGNGS